MLTEKILSFCLVLTFLTFSFRLTLTELEDEINCNCYNSTGRHNYTILDECDLKVEWSFSNFMRIFQILSVVVLKTLKAERLSHQLSIRSSNSLGQKPPVMLVHKRPKLWFSLKNQDVRWYR